MLVSRARQLLLSALDSCLVLAISAALSAGSTIAAMSFSISAMASSLSRIFFPFSFASFSYLCKDSLLPW